MWKQKDAQSCEGYSLHGDSLRSSGMRKEISQAVVLYLEGSTLLCPGTLPHYTPVQYGRQI